MRSMDNLRWSSPDVTTRFIWRGAIIDPSWWRLNENKNNLGLQLFNWWNIEAWILVQFLKKASNITWVLQNFEYYKTLKKIGPEH